MDGRPLVITHAECADGWCSEWLFRRHFGDTAEYMSAKYGDPVPDVSGRPHVYISDFSFPGPEMVALAKACGGRITVLDHHKSADLVLADLVVQGVIGRFGECPRVLFDLNHSGAYLTWKFLKGQGATDPIFADGNPPLIVQYTEDRDLWLWRLPGSKEINAALSSHYRVREVWDGLHEKLATQEGYWELFGQGAAILRAQSQAVDATCRRAVEMHIAGHRVLVVNTTCHHSEIGERLAEGRAFAATWMVGSDGLFRYSLRSNANGVDVSLIAQQFGGGGHVRSAGFTSTTPPWGYDAWT